MHMALLSACMSVYHLPVWCLQRPEEDIIPQEFELQTAVNCWKLNLGLLQIGAVSALIPWALFQPYSLLFLIYARGLLVWIIGLVGDSSLCASLPLADKWRFCRDGYKEFLLGYFSFIKSPRGCSYPLSFLFLKFEI